MSATPAHATTPVTPAKASTRKRVSATRSAAAAGGPLAAFVLHSYDWSETSLIVELFTREKGRIVVVARGAKRPTSNFRAVLMPFHPLAVQLSKAPAGDAEVHSLRSIELAGWVGGLPLAGSAAARGLFASFHLNELLMKLLPRQDAHPALFDTYAQALPMLALGDDVKGQVAVRAFEVALLRELGWLPDLHQVSQTQQAVQAGQAYQLHGEMGVVRAGPAGQAAPGDRVDGVDGAALLQIEAALAHGGFAPLCEAVGPVATRLRGPVRKLLDYHLGASKLRTREVLQGVHALLQP